MPEILCLNAVDGGGVFAELAQHVMSPTSKCGGWAALNFSRYHIWQSTDVIAYLEHFGCGHFLFAGHGDCPLLLHEDLEFGGIFRNADDHFFTPDPRFKNIIVETVHDRLQVARSFAEMMAENSCGR